MPQKIKVEAKDVSQAIEKGLRELGLRRDQVEIKILENPRKGFLGIGAKPAVVELHKKRWISSNLDAQIYMDVPKKKRPAGRNNHDNRRNRKDGIKEIKRGGRRAYTSRHAERAPRENEPQLLPSETIQHAVIPEFLKAPMQEAQDYLSNVLTRMGIKVENLHAWWDEKQNRILLTFDCDHPAIVIGKDGKTLESLQYLATLSISRHFDKPISVIADTQNYWRKAEDKIDAELASGIDKIKNGYSVYRFRPMSAQLRRYIHRAAENNEFVITVSEGEAEYRKVTLRPRPADQPVQKKDNPAAEVAAQQVAANTQEVTAVTKNTPMLQTEVTTEVMVQQTPDTQVVVEEVKTVTQSVQPATAENTATMETSLQAEIPAETAPVAENK